VPFVLLAVLVLAFLTGDPMRQTVIRYAFRRAFEARGLPASWGEALALVETNARPAVNGTGADGRRGGSYGPSQISRQTARAWGYSDRMERLNEDPFFAAELSAAMAEVGFGERGGALAGDRYVYNADGDSAYVLGRPATFEDFLAAWNAGRPFSEAPSSTLAYIDRAKSIHRTLAGSPA
jgi:hypothetical protein